MAILFATHSAWTGVGAYVWMRLARLFRTSRLLCAAGLLQCSMLALLYGGAMPRRVFFAVAALHGFSAGAVEPLYIGFNCAQRDSNSRSPDPRARAVPPAQPTRTRRLTARIWLQVLGARRQVVQGWRRPAELGAATLYPSKPSWPGPRSACLRHRCSCATRGARRSGRARGLTARRSGTAGRQSRRSCVRPRRRTARSGWIGTTSCVT